MKEIMDQYGPAVIQVLAVALVLALLVAFFAGGTDSTIGKAFSNIINIMFEKATSQLNGIG